MTRRLGDAGDSQSTERDLLQAKVDALPWHHELDLEGGVRTPGMTKLEVLTQQADIYFKDGVAGRSVLDIGCWDGYNSFEAKRRGARRVLATDHFAWSEACWGNRASFDLARKRLAPDVEVMDIDVPEITPESVGVFEIVLFLGVLYHLRHPLTALEGVSAVCSSMIVLETHLDAFELDRPGMIFYPNTELADDPTNWWGPNSECVVAMLKDVGFSEVHHEQHPLHPNRSIFHGYK
jgi:tRNA (mo5U34)-methyltransferase